MWALSLGLLILAAVVVFQAISPESSMANESTGGPEPVLKLKDDPEIGTAEPLLPNDDPLRREVLGDGSGLTGNADELELAMSNTAWGANASVQEMAEYYGVTTTRLHELMEAGPGADLERFASKERRPLSPWASVEPKLANRLIRSMIGRELDADSLFVSEILGTDLDSFLFKQAGNVSDVKGAAMKVAITDVLAAGRSDYQYYRNEASFAIEDKVYRGDYDRYPHKVVSYFASNTNQGGGVLFATSLGLETWMVTFELHAGEYPEYEKARDSWRLVAEGLLSDANVEIGYLLGSK